MKSNRYVMPITRAKILARLEEKWNNECSIDPGYWTSRYLEPCFHIYTDEWWWDGDSATILDGDYIDGMERMTDHDVILSEWSMTKPHWIVTEKARSIIRELSSRREYDGFPDIYLLHDGEGSSLLFRFAYSVYAKSFLEKHSRYLCPAFHDIPDDPE